jgi:hypothetical protein
MARKVFRDCHVFLEAYGTANGSKDAGVDIIDLADESLPVRRWNYTMRTMEIEDVATQMAAFKQELRFMLM